MKFFKSVFFLFFKQIINFLIYFYSLKESNLKNKKNFIYIEKKPEYLNLNNDNYYIYNQKNKFFFFKFKKIIIPRFYKFFSSNSYAIGSGDYPVFLNRNFRLFMDSINSNIKYFLSAGVLKKLIKLIIKSNTKKLDKVVIFSGSLSDNKFHWLIDYLPRLQNIIENNQVNDFVFILNKNQIKFNEFYLEKLGILKKNFYYWDGNSIMIKKLYLFSLRYLNFRSNRYQIYSHSSIQWLKKTFDNKFENIEKNINYEKICILRKKNDSRSIVNDEEFKNFLKELNYKFIYLEDFTEEQIIQIFKSANILIAVHGASLANMIFSNNLKLIEIYPQSRPEEDAFVYYQISRILKFEHHLYLVDDNKKKEGIIINMKIFKEKLRNIL
tara:strand:+ start:1172 stop:2317 length:1146 start_codon:yes stop_codon:yes gene_type:complete